MRKWAKAMRSWCYWHGHNYVRRDDLDPRPPAPIHSSGRRRHLRVPWMVCVNCGKALNEEEVRCG